VFASADDYRTAELLADRSQPHHTLYCASKSCVNFELGWDDGGQPCFGPEDSPTPSLNDQTIDLFTIEVLTQQAFVGDNDDHEKLSPP